MRNLSEAEKTSNSTIDANLRSPSFYKNRSEQEEKLQKQQQAIDEGSPIQDMDRYNTLCEAAKGNSTHITHADVEKKLDDARKESPVKVNPAIELDRKREEERLRSEEKRLEALKEQRRLRKEREDALKKEQLRLEERAKNLDLAQQEQRRLRKEKEDVSRAKESFSLFSPNYLARKKSESSIASASSTSGSPTKPLINNTKATNIATNRTKESNANNR